MTKEVLPVLWLVFNGVAISIPMDVKPERLATVQEIENSGPVEPCVMPYCSN